MNWKLLGVVLMAATTLGAAIWAAALGHTVTATLLALVLGLTVGWISSELGDANLEAVNEGLRMRNEILQAQIDEARFGSGRAKMAVLR